MLLKVLTCDCFLSYLNDTKIEFEVQNRSGACEHNVPNIVVVTK